MAGLEDVRVINPPTVDIGGKVRSIIYDMNAFAELERRYGSIQVALDALMEGKIKDVKTILWAGLIHDEVELDEDGEPLRYLITPYQVGGWVKRPSDMGMLVNKVGEALNAASPPVEAATAEAGKVGSALPAGTAQEVLSPEEQQEKNG